MSFFLLNTSIQKHVEHFARTCQGQSTHLVFTLPSSASISTMVEHPFLPNHLAKSTSASETTTEVSHEEIS